MSEPMNPLGNPCDYPDHYDPRLLFPISRDEKRREIGIGENLPFKGHDVWTAYELSWLNSKGKPQVAIAEFHFPCESQNIVESKSFKLYLNSLNQKKFATWEQLKALLLNDLSNVVNAQVHIDIYTLNEFAQSGFSKVNAICLDDLDIHCEDYHYNPGLLTIEKDQSDTEQLLISHLLKSNCLITSQPDWASVVIHYKGRPIEQTGLLKYLISFRGHNEFHEQCVERIFQDIKTHCQPSQLTVYARYTRRGGLDINPWRSDFENNLTMANSMGRLVRQ